MAEFSSGFALGALTVLVLAGATVAVCVWASLNAPEDDEPDV